MDDAAWDALVADAAEPDPLALASVLALRDPLSEGTGYRVTVAATDGRPIAGAALRRRSVRGLRRLGHHLNDPNRFTPGFFWDDPQSLGRLVALLLEQPADILELREIPERSPLVQAVCHAIPAARVRPDAQRFVADLGAGSVLSRSVRRNCRRSERLASAAGIALECAYLADQPRLANVLPDSIDLLARARLRDALDPYLTQPAGRRYMLALMEVLEREEHLRLALVTANGRPVAVATAAVLGRSAVGHRTAFDRDLRTVPGLGWLALVTLIDGLVDEGITRLNVGSGTAEHKRAYAEAEHTVAITAPLSVLGRVALQTSRVLRRSTV